ncbi:hypothetical protein [Polyangium mundeleinium]|uniref:Uncharacterized protein n=1 Tax=Polyangium mundeleinium TaxID=2995306 RepID=A0ABT5EQE9_9BACT|nr:hypothetical protein [Polyangium mundeleinium]MDC0744061.1 hypothetical protein [Polyangium mundeleinium]
MKTTTCLNIAGWTTHARTSLGMFAWLNLRAVAFAVTRTFASRLPDSNIWQP